MNDIYVRAELCLKFSNYKKYYKALIAFNFLFCVCLAHAGSCLGETAGVALSTDSIKPLKIGDSIPEELWHLPLQVVNHPEGKDTITLNDYRDSKLIVLEFWATYCHPCIRSIEKFDSIQQNYTANELMLLPVQVYDDVDRALPFIEKHEWNLSSVVGDTLMNKGYFARYLTGFGIVWIADGRLLAVPSIKSINATNVDRAVRRHPLHIINRKEQTIDHP